MRDVLDRIQVKDKEKGRKNSQGKRSDHEGGLTSMKGEGEGKRTSLRM